jgi:hypothetical protein
MKITDTDATKYIDAFEHSPLGVADLVRKLKRLEEFRVGLLKRAKFQTLSRVYLKETPEITEKKSWGWLSYKHFLIKGATGIVREVDFWSDKFVYAVEMDNQTWVDTNGLQRPVDKPGLFYFGEEWLEADHKRGWIWNL